jgi:hypothetical protein
MRQPIRTTLLFAASMVMGLAALMNATAAVPHLHEDLVEINVRPTLLSAVLLAMHFTSFAMFAFALIILFAAIQSRVTGIRDLCFRVEPELAHLRLRTDRSADFRVAGNQRKIADAAAIARSRSDRHAQLLLPSPRAKSVYAPTEGH